MAKKLSFFDRLTGASYDDDFNAFEEETVRGKPGAAPHAGHEPHNELAPEPQEVGEAQLTVDVYQTPNEILIKALVASVRPDDLDIAIT